MRDLDHVRDLVSRDDALIFVGSGVSLWSGLPSWPGLLASMADELDRLGRDSTMARQEMQAGDLLLAASYASEELSTEERCSFLRRSFSSSGRTPSELHKAIARIGVQFLTTNYDGMLELALAGERPDEHFEIVTPAHKLEIPAIVQARANHFVFKAHGDVSNCETIVLTREDYRQLKVKRSVPEAVRTLMASRPVLFVGFGLRDPDFLLMRDEIFGSYGANPSDHVAIMADVHEAEARYWRRHYGIHLVSYTTDSNAVNRHANLLGLIESLAQLRTDASADPVTPTINVLSLARYARGLGSIHRSSLKPFPLELVPVSSPGGNSIQPEVWRLVRRDASAALTNFSGHLVIEGPPGAGKSFVASGVCETLAQRLELACLSSDEAVQLSPIPVMIPLRDYDGDLTRMLEQLLPTDVDLRAVLSAGRGFLILDGVNEVPPSREAQLLVEIRSLLEQATGSSVLITTRFAGPLSTLDLPTCRLDSVGEAYVAGALREAGVQTEIADSLLTDLLRRPLFFSAWKAGDIDLDSVTSVHDIYTQLVARDERAISSAFGAQLSMVEIAGKLAYEMVDSGQLSAPLATVVGGFLRNLPDGVDPQALVDRMLDSGILLATPTRRLAFYHHSVTEYLAARHLASLILLDRSVVEECLGRRDWDQALLLSLGFLDKEVASEVQASVMRVDTAVGLRALLYVEGDRSEWVARALSSIPSDLPFHDEREIARALGDLPFDAEHLDGLTAISERPDGVGAAATVAIWRIQPEARGDILESLAFGRGGYNRVVRIAEQLCEEVSEEDALECLHRLASRETNDGPPVTEGELEREAFVAEVSAVGTLLRASSVEKCIDFARTSKSLLATAAVNRRIMDFFDPVGCTFLREQVVAGSALAIFPHYLQIAHLSEADGASLPPPSEALVDALVGALRNERSSAWALGSLRSLARWAPIFSEYSSVRVQEGLAGALLEYAKGADESFEDRLEALLDSDLDWEQEPVAALRVIDSWSEDLVVAVCRFGGDALVEAVLEGVRVARHFGEYRIPFTAFLESFIDRIEMVARSNEHRFRAFVMGQVLGGQSDDPTREALIGMFNEKPERRAVLHDWVMWHVRDLDAAELSADATAWLYVNALAPLSTPGFPEHSVLVLISTEEMVQDELLPRFLAEKDETRRALLSEMLHAIGLRHNRRYIGHDWSYVD